MQKKSKVLIIEDDPRMLYAFSRTIKAAGYEVLEAATGEDGLQQVRHLQPDLVLLDVVLPDIDGFEVCKKIKSDPELARCLVIQLSGIQISSDSRVGGLDSGADGYLTKPISNRALLAHVQAMMRIKQAEAALIEQREWFRVTLASIGDGVIATNVKGKITFINSVAQRLTGVSESEAVGFAINEIFTMIGKDGARYPIDLDAGLEQGQCWDSVNDAELVSRSGEKFSIRNTITPIRNNDNEIIGSVMVFQDITAQKLAQQALEQAKAELELKVAERTDELKQLNEQLMTDIGMRKLAEEKLTHTAELLKRHAEELSRSNDELEQFASIASHDLQEPLRMVTSFIQLLKERYAGQIDNDADEFIKFAVDGVARMQEMIRDLLSYSRVGAHQRKFAPVDCEKILLDTIANLHVAIEETDTLITYDPLPTVIADETQFGQLFQNLIGNAIKFHGDSRPEIHISAEARAEDWLFSVRDNGVGIDSKYAERIFVIFQRLQKRSEYPGTGMGLAICKKIVERHGGSIWVESRAGAGSTFYFTIPRSDNLNKGLDLL